MGTVGESRRQSICVISAVRRSVCTMTTKTENRQKTYFDVSYWHDWVCIRIGWFMFGWLAMHGLFTLIRVIYNVAN